MSALLFLYRLMLYAYPRRFRLEYGQEMERLFAEKYRDAAARGRGGHVANFVSSIAGDWLRSAGREWFDSARSFVVKARNSGPRGMVSEWILTGLIYLFASTALVQAYVVPTGSMEGNLRVGDHIFVDKTAYGNPGMLGRYLMPYRDVQRGDIVAFLFPDDTSQTFVKRVIGLPGDRIRMSAKQVIRNGHRLVEPYTQHIDPALVEDRDDFPLQPGTLTSVRGREMLEHHVVNGEIVVPPGALFVMGDNRDNSLDSRYWGFVPRGYVVGKPVLVYWSYDAPTEELTGWSGAHVRDVATHFFSKTRWDRTFLVPRPQRAGEAGE